MKPLLLRFAILIGGVLVCVSGLSYWTAWQILYSTLDATLPDRVSALSRWEEDRPPDQTLEETFPHLLVQITNLKGKGQDRSSNLSEDLAIPEEIREKALTTQGPVLTTLSVRSLGTLRVAVSVRHDRNGLVAGLVCVAVPLSEFDRRLRTLASQLAAGSVLILSLSVFIVFLLLKRWLGPIRQMTEVLDETSAGTLPQAGMRIAVTGDDIGRLAEAFQKVLQRLEKSVRSQERFLADAAHELRTPLAILRGEIEVALRKTRTAQEYQEVFHSNLEELERISRLINNLLTLAQADSGNRLIHPETLDLSLLCREVCAKLQPLAAVRGLTLELVTDPEVRFSADHLALERVVSNIVENAIQYTPANGSVVVSLRIGDSGIVLSVADTGPGIPAEDLPHVFERFYRVDKSRTGEKAGGGLGLAIAKTLAEAHRARVEVSSEPGRGSTFTVTFPS